MLESREYLTSRDFRPESKEDRWSREESFRVVVEYEDVPVVKNPISRSTGSGKFTN